MKIENDLTMCLHRSSTAYAGSSSHSQPLLHEQRHTCCQIGCSVFFFFFQPQNKILLLICKAQERFCFSGWTLVGSFCCICSNAVSENRQNNDGISPFSVNLIIKMRLKKRWHFHYGRHVDTERPFGSGKKKESFWTKWQFQQIQVWDCWSPFSEFPLLGSTDKKGQRCMQWSIAVINLTQRHCSSFKCSLTRYNSGLQKHISL